MQCTSSIGQAFQYEYSVILMSGRLVQIYFTHVRDTVVQLLRAHRMLYSGSTHTRHAVLMTLM